MNQRLSHTLAWLACLSFMLIIMLGGGALMSDFQLTEDYGIVKIHQKFEQGESFFNVGKDIMIEDDMKRVRLYSFWRTFQTMVFGLNIFWFRLTLLIMGTTTIWGYYRFSRALGVEWPEGMGLGLLLMAGDRMIVWWRMAVDENLGMFFLALSLCVMASRPVTRPGRRFKSFGFMMLVALMSFSKENFIIVVPAVLLLKIWLDHRQASVSLTASLRSNILPVGVLMTMIAIQLVILIMNTGTYIGYVGIEGNVDWSRCLSTFRQLGQGYFSVMGVIALLYILGLVFTKGRDFKPAMREMGWAVVICLAWLIPTILLIEKVGVRAPHYHFPGAFAFFFFILMFYLQVKRQGFLWARILLIVVMVALIVPRSTEAYHMSRQFAEEGQAARTLSRELKDLTDKGDPILFVLDPARHLEWNHALSKFYFPTFADRENFYLFPILRTNYTEWEKFLVRESHLSPLKLYKNRVFFHSSKPRRFKAIVVFPYVEMLFLMRSKDWFERQKYNGKSVWKFAIYYLKEA